MIHNNICCRPFRSGKSRLGASDWIVSIFGGLHDDFIQRSFAFIARSIIPIHRSIATTYVCCERNEWTILKLITHSKGNLLFSFKQFSSQFT